MNTPSHRPGADGAHRFDDAAIEHLMQLLCRSDLSEMRLVHGDASLHLIRAARSDAGAEPAAPEGAPSAAAAPADAARTPGTVCAPLYGIVHLTPAPGKPTFVQLGSRVHKGQTLLLIEAMKTFHEVQAECDGVVTALLAQAGDEVQAGAPLVVLSSHV